MTETIPVLVLAGGIRPLPGVGRPTGLFKTPVQGALALGWEGFEGDQQADRRVHGGPDKAVHFYPADHYGPLAARFAPAAEGLVPGTLGENLSAAGLDEREVRIGECWRLGTALLQVCQPRNPCWKIDARHASEGMAAFMAEQRITGWYLRVIEPGVVGLGDALRRLPPPPHAPTLHAAQALCAQHRPEVAALERLAHTEGLARDWRDRILQRCAWLRSFSGEGPGR